ncbi:hypothetical protein J6590_015204 [Homalodisca vitripennis]|nr:hypothetical protein J6590_015204 [Homalodisca vitripennis]
MDCVDQKRKRCACAAPFNPGRVQALISCLRCETVMPVVREAKFRHLEAPDLSTKRANLSSVKYWPRSCYQHCKVWKLL